jgi:hypothetical protein
MQGQAQSRRMFPQDGLTLFCGRASNGTDTSNHEHATPRSPGPQNSKRTQPRKRRQQRSDLCNHDERARPLLTDVMPTTSCGEKLNHIINRESHHHHEIHYVEKSLIANAQF